MRLQVVVGGQFGSEAKGHVTRQLVDLAVHNDEKVLNIRVAGPNAGHCAYDDKGNRWALRQVPVGGTNNSGRITLYIAPGSEIDPDVLLAEIDQMDEAGLDVGSRLIVSPEATVLEPAHKYRESGMHERIGSTGKGIGAARADRIMRTAKRVADDLDLVSRLYSRGVSLVTLETNDLPGSFDSVIIEGTQGYGLGLHAGFYPQCTSSDTRAIDFLAMAGISPWHRAIDRRAFEVWVVARVYPIRVAGNSGPLRNETSWEDLGLEPEKTTVTQKVRRVGEWDPHLVRAAVQANGGQPVVRLALTMVDQKFPWLKQTYGDYDMDLAHRFGTDEQWHQFEDFIAKIEDETGAPIRMITTSPTHAVWRDHEGW